MRTATVDRGALAWLAGRAHDRLRMGIVRNPSPFEAEQIRKWYQQRGKPVPSWIPDPAKVAEAMGRLKTQIWTAEFFEDRHEERLAEMENHEFYVLAPRRRAVEAARKGVEWEGASPDSRAVLMETIRRLGEADAHQAKLREAAERLATDSKWSRDEYDRILKQYAREVAEEADRRVRALPNPYREDLPVIRQTEARFLPSGQVMRVPAVRRASAPAAPPAPATTPAPPARTTYASPTAPSPSAAATPGTSGAWWPMSALAPGFGVQAASFT